MTGVSLLATGRVEQTYTLTVADWHTFFVGNDRVLVHNAKCPDGPQRKGSPGNNQAQNKAFADATRGLTKEQKRIVHDEITGRDMTYHDIREIAEAVKNGTW